MPKGVYVRKKKQQEQSLTDDTAPHDDNNDGSSVSGRLSSSATAASASSKIVQSVPKLLLKVPPSLERNIGKAPFSTGGTKKQQKFCKKDVKVEEEEEEDESDSDLEPLSEKVLQPGKLNFDLDEMSDQDTDGKSENKDDSEAGGTVTKTKRKYRKRRFRLTTDRVKTKKKIKTENDEEEKNQEKTKEPTPEPEPESLSVPMPSRKRLGEYDELQLLLDSLLRTFQRKDPEQYFALPVTDEIAPNYSSTISTPMDFCTMRIKLDKMEYLSLADFKADIELICSNAVLYNDQNTVYHQAARKLESVVEHVFSEQNLSFLLKTLPFIKTLTLDALGVAAVKTEKPKSKKAGVYSCVADNLSAEEVLAQVQESAAKAAQKLASRKADSRLAFLKQKDDGTTVLNFVAPEKSGEGGNEEEDSKPVKLGDLIPKLKEGTPGLPAFTEPQNNPCVPVSYLDYGPYSSFAPQYDSTWATLNKEDSDLLLRTYGDQAGAQYAWSLKSFAKGAGDYVSKMVDNVLDAITDGEHSKTVTQLEKGEVESRVEIVAEKPVGDNIDFESLRSLENLGLDVSYLSEIESQLETKKEKTNQDFLDRTGLLLSDLQTIQHQRLSQQPDFTLTRTDGPSQKETRLAGVVINSLQKITSQVTPAQLVSETAVRGLMAISSPTDDIDMDVLNEFLVPE